MKAQVMLKDGEKGEMHMFYVKLGKYFYWYKTFLTKDGETLDLQIMDEDGKQVEDASIWKSILDAVNEFQKKSVGQNPSPFYIDGNA